MLLRPRLWPSARRGSARSARGGTSSSRFAAASERLASSRSARARTPARPRCRSQACSGDRANLHLPTSSRPPTSERHTRRGGARVRGRGGLLGRATCRTQLDPPARREAEDRDSLFDEPGDDDEVPLYFQCACECESAEGPPAQCRQQVVEDGTQCWVCSQQPGLPATGSTRRVRGLIRVWGPRMPSSH